MIMLERNLINVKLDMIIKWYHIPIVITWSYSIVIAYSWIAIT